MNREFDPGLRAAAQAMVVQAQAAGPIVDPLALRSLVDGPTSPTGRRPAVATRPDVHVRDVALPDDGARGGAGPLVLRCHTPAEGRPRAVVLYLHGGGLVGGTALAGDEKEQRYAAEAGVAIVAVEYRLAPEHPYPAALDDALAALTWADAHRAELGAGGDAPLAVLGSSAGAAIAAGLVLHVREHGGPRLSAQLLLHPMLDDRTGAAPADIAPLATWPAAANRIAWEAYLPGRAGGSDVPATAAPARAEDLRGLPPTYLDVGDLDLFRDETLAYAARLAVAAVPIELHVRPGLPHAGEGLAPDAQLSREIIQTRIRALSRLGRGRER